MTDTPYGKKGAGRATGQVNVHAGHSGSHSYDEEEKIAFVDWINDVLADDDLCQCCTVHANQRFLEGKLPISMDGDEFFNAVHDGIILCCLINDAVPDTIDERAINTKKLSTFTKHENQTLVINSAKGIGCSVVNIGPKDLMDGTKHLILGLVWQIVKIGLLSKINLTVHPELYRLLEAGETLEDLLKLPAEQLLLRWVNYQLAQAGSNKRIKNFQGDIADSEAYTILIKQISPNSAGCDTSPLNESDRVKRADKMLEQADKIDCRKFVRPKDVVNGVPKLNLAFVANLFNHYPALEPVEEEIKIIEETREEKSFRNWMNSLGVDPYVDSVPLYIDLQDGLIILQLMDKVDPGSVDWNKRVTRNFSRIGAKAKMEKLENCNYAVELAKNHFNFSVVGIDGNDIREGKPMMVLSILWQLMRRNVLNILHDIAAKQGKSGKIEEHEIIEWANTKMSDAGKSPSFKSFSDPVLSDSKVMLNLIDAVRPGSVNYDLFLDDGSEQSLEKNARLCVTLARKIGAVIFALPEDIIECNKKMCMTVFASLMAVDLAG